MMQISIIPKEFVHKYNLKEKVHNGYIFKHETKGMYRLPQVGLIAHDTLVQRL